MRRVFVVAGAFAALLTVRATCAEEMIVALRVNGQARGDVLIDTQADGSIRINAQDAAKLGFTPERLSAITPMRDAAVLVNNQSLGVKLNTETLTLDVTAEANWFARNVLSLSTRGRVVTSTLDGLHGWLNYSLAMQAASAVRPSGAIETSAVISHGAWTVRSDQNAAFRESGNTFNRTLSSLAYDDAARLTRLSFGDFTAAAGVGTTASRSFGIQWARHFEFDPAVATQPTFNWSGQVRTPSTVDVFVDGIRAKTFTVAPGPFDLRDLAYFSGLRNVEVLIRDRAGVETRIQVPYYFASELLAEGKDSFDVSGGVADTNQGARPWVFSGSYKRGLNDNVTLGVGTEAKAAYQSVRVDLAGRHESLGTIFATAAASKSRGGSILSAATLAHSWNSGRISTQFSGAWQQRGFGVDPDARSVAREMSQRLTASASFSFDQQRSASVNFSHVAFASGAPEHLLSLRVAQGWGRGMNAWASISQVHQNLARATAIAIGVSFPLGQNWSLSSGYSKQTGEAAVTSLRASRSDSGNSGDSSDVFDGWADVRLAAEHRGDSTTLDGFVQRPLRLGVVAVSARAEQRGALSDASGELRFSGALAWADRQFWMSPQIAQSFAIVDAAGVEGVRVTHNNQLVGRTNAKGRLLLPSLAAYTANQVRIDDRDIPMEIELSAVQQDVAPRMNAGTIAKFTGKRVSAVAGVLQFVPGTTAETVMLAAAQVTATNGAATITSSTDGDGGFYLENLAPGQWTVAVLGRKARCNANITVPSDSPSFLDLGRIPCLKS